MAVPPPLRGFVPLVGAPAGGFAMPYPRPASIGPSNLASTIAPGGVLWARRASDARLPPTSQRTVPSGLGRRPVLLHPRPGRFASGAAGVSPAVRAGKMPATRTIERPSRPGRFASGAAGVSPAVRAAKMPATRTIERPSRPGRFASGTAGVSPAVLYRTRACGDSIAKPRRSR